MTIAQKLSVWEKAHELSLAAHRALLGPQARTFATIASALQRLSIAIVVHITEGAESDSPVHFIDRIDAAIAVTREFDYLLLLASDLGALSKSHRAKLEARCDQVRRMLVGLRSTVRRRVAPRREGRGEHSLLDALPHDTKRR